MEKPQICARLFKKSFTEITSAAVVEHDAVAAEKDKYTNTHTLAHTSILPEDSVCN